MLHFRIHYQRVLEKNYYNYSGKSKNLKMYFQRVFARVPTH